MEQWLNEYWYLLVVLFAVTVVAVIILRMACKAYRKRMSLIRKEEETIKHLVALKKKFRPITEEAIMSADINELLEGIALSYQLDLQKEEKQEEKFVLLNDDIKDIYTLDIFVQDKTVKEFFSQNGEILRERIVPALIKIGLEEFAEKIKCVYDMYNINNESVSFDIKKIEKIDNYISSVDFYEQVVLKSGEYIRNNFKSFIN